MYMHVCTLGCNRSSVINIDCKHKDIMCLTFLLIDESDYESSFGVLKFEAGSWGDSSCVDIVIVIDDVKEKNETFVFAICEGGDKDIDICYNFADIHIIDDDCK